VQCGAPTGGSALFRTRLANGLFRVGTGLLFAYSMQPVPLHGPRSFCCGPVFSVSPVRLTLLQPNLVGQSADFGVVCVVVHRCRPKGLRGGKRPRWTDGSASVAELPTGCECGAQRCCPVLPDRASPSASLTATCRDCAVPFAGCPSLRARRSCRAAISWRRSFRRALSRPEPEVKGDS